MKKKLFLGALLLGALTLNSCVDNVESDSVKSVRQAKAEQLKAQADYQKAMGEAELINANVAKAAQEIAAKVEEARAEYLKAQAESEKARAALANAQAESERVAAAEAAEQAKIDLEKAQAELESYKMEMAKLVAQYEAELYKQQLAALNAKKDYEDAVKNAEKEEIAALMLKYENAADELLEGQQKLAQMKLDLAKLNAGITDATKAIQDEINDLNIENNTLQTKIEAAQASINIIRDDDYAEAEAALPEAQKTLDALNKTETDKLYAMSSASAAETNAKAALDNSDYQYAINKITAFQYSSYIFEYYDYSGTQTKRYTLTVALNNNKWSAAAKTSYYDSSIANWNDSGTDEIPLFSNIKKETKFVTYLDSYVDYNGDPQTYPYRESYDFYTEYYNLVADGSGMDKFVSAAKTFVANGAQKNFDDAKKAYDDQAKVVADIQKLYDALVPLQKTWIDALAAQGADTTGDPDGNLAQAVTDAVNAFAKAVKDQEINNVDYDNDYQTNGIDSTVRLCESNLNSAKSDLTRKLRDKNSAENTLNAANEKVAEIEGYAKTLKAGNAGNTAAMNAYNDAQAAYCQAKIDYEVAKNAAGIQNAKVNALNLIVTAGAPTHISSWNQNKAEFIRDRENEIAGYEYDIEENNQKIALLEKELADGEPDLKLLIANKEADIANQEAKNLVLENKVKAAKEELDAALGEPEETPAE